MPISPETVHNPENQLQTPSWEPLLRLIGDSTQKKPIFVRDLRGIFIDGGFGDEDTFKNQFDFLRHCPLYDVNPTNRPSSEKRRAVTSIRFIKVSLKGEVNLASAGQVYLESNPPQG